MLISRYPGKIFEFLDVKNKEKPQSHSSRLNLSDFSETADGRAGGSGSRCPVQKRVVSTCPITLPIYHLPPSPDALLRSGDLRNSVGTTGNGLVATATLPDTNSLALDGVLSAEGADVAGVLLDFHLLHLLTQGGTVSVIEHIVSTTTPQRKICPPRNRIFRDRKTSLLQFLSSTSSTRTRNPYVQLVEFRLCAWKRGGR